MQQRKFILNLALLIILNLLIKPFWILIIDPGVQYQVGNAHYGEYSALFMFSFLLTIFLDFGLTNFNNKNIAQNNHLLSKHFSSLLSLKFVLGIIYIMLTMLCAYIVGYDARYMKLLLILCINQFFISFILYLRSNLQGLHLFKTDSIVSILDRLIMILICFALFWHWFGLEVDIMNYVYAQTIGYGLTALITFWIVLKETHTFKLTWNWRFSYMMLKKSFPFAILVLLQTFYNRIDSVMIERMLPAGVGAAEAGIYAKGFRLLEAAMMIGFLFATQLLPIFSRMLEFKEDVQNLVKLSFSLLITPSIIVSMGCAFYSNELCLLINKSTDSAPVFSTLMFCFTASSISYIFGTLLTANGNLKQMNIMAICGILINVILNVILIPQFHAFGSAIASVTTQFMTALIQVFIAVKIFKFKTNKRLLIALVFFIFGVACINYLSLHLTKQWMLNFAIMVAASGLWAFVTGIINIKSVLRFIKYK
ncbi:MAG: oligosaccharide flippase family protein [Bacteroidia bacterium]|nr:oligosaccharide flippase family protein [Bacteroidia bacterium]